MGAKLQAFSRCRPRVLTVVVFFVVAATIVLANLSFDRGTGRGGLGSSYPHKSYGWPFIWHRCISVVAYVNFADVGWYYSRTRLAANVAIWLVMLASASGGCEWLFRRYRPPLRWSLKKMLAAVAMVAVFCAWFVAARDRADVEDQVIEALGESVPAGVDHGDGCSLWVHRWGPKWLDLFGADRFRRHIVFLNLSSYGRRRWDVDPADDEFLRHLGQLPDLRGLSFATDRFSPAMAAALNGMRRLRWLKIVCQAPNRGDGPLALDARLPPIGNMTRLNHLELAGLTIDADSLAGLANLKSLRIVACDLDKIATAELDRSLGWAENDGDDTEGEGDAETDHGGKQLWRSSLAAIGTCTGLERLELAGMRISAESLQSLARLTQLRTLSLQYVTTDELPLTALLRQFPQLELLKLQGDDFGDEDIRELARLPRLKLLALIDTSVSPAGLAELATFDRLEELELQSDLFLPNTDLVSPAGLASLVAVKHLSRLHLHQYPPYADQVPLELDHGNLLMVWKPDLEAFRRALQALRDSHPGLVIDNDGYAICAELSFAERARRCGYEPLHVVQAAWIPGPDFPGGPTLTWQTAFSNRGGWARFDAIGIPIDDEGHVATVEF